jgi:hypothetical protein
MCEQDAELKTLLESARMPAEADPTHMQAVRRRMASIANSPRPRRTRPRTVLVAALLLVVVSTIGIATTDAGHNLIRWIFTPVEPSYFIRGEPETNSAWTVVRSGDAAQPFTAEEEEKTRAQMTEAEQIRQAGGGKLAALLEYGGYNGIGTEGYSVIYIVKYTLSDGETRHIGENRPTGDQAANMRIDEIMELRDSGAGEVVSETPSDLGLGRYTIRFTLSDGETIDLMTYYPPGTREEREAITAEALQLWKERRFSVLNAHASSHPDGRVCGVLRYTLADGRCVGLTGMIPPDVITEDGKYVVMPANGEPVPIQNAGGSGE